MIVDHISNWRRYGFGPAWEETMRWLENYAPGGSGSLADLTDGTHPLTDGFVSVATLTSRPLSGSLYECHKRFCDVQMVVEGVYSAKAARRLAQVHEVPMPIIEEVNAVLFEAKPASEAVRDLMMRDRTQDRKVLTFEINAYIMKRSFLKRGGDNYEKNDFSWYGCRIGSFHDRLQLRQQCGRDHCRCRDYGCSRRRC